MECLDLSGNMNLNVLNVERQLGVIMKILNQFEELEELEKN
jgi:hypothetical protein